MLLASEERIRRIINWRDFYRFPQKQAMKRLLFVLSLSLFFYSCKKEATPNPQSLPNGYSNQALGKSAVDLLTSTTYTTLNIQVQYMPGYELEAATIGNLTSYLTILCNKPGGISITQSPIAANGHALTVDSAAIIERNNRTAYTSGNTIAVYILVTDGFDTSLSTLGFAYRNTSICIFGKDIFTNSGGIGQASRVALETSVLEHEFGHILGLVNLGTPMVTFHQDVVHNNHCTNPHCLMYYAIDTHGVLPGMSNVVAELDSNCRNDLRANGGK